VVSVIPLDERRRPWASVVLFAVATDEQGAALATPHLQQSAQRLSMPASMVVCSFHDFRCAGRCEGTAFLGFPVGVRRGRRGHDNGRFTAYR